MHWTLLVKEHRDDKPHPLLAIQAKISKMALRQMVVPRVVPLQATVLQVVDRRAAGLQMAVRPAMDLQVMVLQADLQATDHQVDLQATDLQMAVLPAEALQGDPQQQTKSQGF